MGRGGGGPCRGCSPPWANGRLFATSCCRGPSLLVFSRWPVPGWRMTPSYCSAPCHPLTNPSPPAPPCRGSGPRPLPRGCLFGSGHRAGGADGFDGRTQHHTVWEGGRTGVVGDGSGGRSRAAGQPPASCRPQQATAAGGVTTRPPGTDGRLPAPLALFSGRSPQTTLVAAPVRSVSHRHRGRPRRRGSPQQPRLLPAPAPPACYRRRRGC